MLNFMYFFVRPWAKSNKFQIFVNRLIGFIANLIYPLYCKIVPLKYNSSDQIIVSLTSYPARIKKVHITINSLMRQKRKDYKVILWLASSQFKKEEDLPKKLRKLEKKGLEIRYCNDLKSYKKIFYTAQEYSDKIIVTTDDDTLYPENWLSGLIDTHKEFQNCIVCYRAHRITFNSMKNILPYTKWEALSPDFKGPSKELVAIGVGGVLYPANTFKKSDFDYNIIKKCAPTTDDMWLKVMIMKKNMKIVKVNNNSKEWFTIRNSQKTSLKQINVSADNKNDISLKNLLKAYHLAEKDFMDTKNR